MPNEEKFDRVQYSSDPIKNEEMRSIAKGEVRMYTAPSIGEGRDVADRATETPAKREVLQLSKLLTPEEMQKFRETSKLHEVISGEEMWRRGIERAFGKTLTSELYDDELIAAIKKNKDFYNRVVNMANKGAGIVGDEDEHFKKLIRRNVEILISKHRGEQLAARDGIVINPELKDPNAGLSNEQIAESRDAGEAMARRMGIDIVNNDEDLPNGRLGRLARKMMLPLKRAHANANYVLAAAYGKLIFDPNVKHVERWQNMSEEEREKHKKKVGGYATLTVLGAAGILLAGRYAPGLWESASGGNGGGSDGVPDVPHRLKGGNGPHGNAEHPMIRADSGNNGIDGENNLEGSGGFFDVDDPAEKVTEKLRPNNYAPPLPDVHMGNTTEMDAFKDALFNQLRGNPRELADYLGRMEIGGAPRPEDFDTMDEYYQAVNTYAFDMAANPQEHMDQFNQLAAKLDNEIANIELVSVTNPYMSPYIENGIVYYDSYVDHDGTAIRVTFKDGSTLDIGQGCGQPIDFIKQHHVEHVTVHETPHYQQPVVVHHPPQPPQYETPPPQAPPPNNPPNNPPPENPPPPPENPPEQPPPPPPENPPEQPPPPPPEEEEPDKTAHFPHPGDGTFRPAPAHETPARDDPTPVQQQDSESGASSSDAPGSEHGSRPDSGVGKQNDKADKPAESAGESESHSGDQGPPS